MTFLWGLAKGYAKTREAGRHVKVVEGEEFNAAVDEAMARAVTLQTHVRYLTREEMRELKDAGPTLLQGLTIRLAERITTRTIPPSRRARRR